MTVGPGGAPKEPDEFEAFVDDWLRDRGRPDPGQVHDVVEGLDRLGPPQHRPLRTIIAAAIGVLMLVGAGAYLGRLPAGPTGEPTGSASAPTFGTDASNFSSDPRVALCRASLTDVDRVFEMTHARWFPLYFPGWWKGAPELEVDDPAIVVLETPRIWPTTGGAWSGPGTPPPSTPSFRMCIAVGPSSDAIIHLYGPTSFDRIVPVLSADDIARAGHMDPEVLADPANWSVPERLAPCGGMTAGVEYVFEAVPLSNFTRYFPAVGPVAAFDTDSGATIVVFRGSSGLRLPQLAPGGSGMANGHDVCVIPFDEGLLSPARLLPSLDISGFHVNLDGSSPSPRPTMSPDAATALDLVTRFETARASENWDGAWALLSEQTKGQIGSETTFTADQAAYNAAGGKTFSIQAPTQDVELMANFLGGAQAQIAEVADVTRGYLVFVLHPDYPAASAGTTGLFVAPLASGDWRIWIVH